MTITEQLKGVFHRVFDDESMEIRREMTAEEVDMWDSLTHMELMANIEETFEIEFSFDQVSSFTNVGDIIDCLARLKAGK